MTRVKIVKRYVTVKFSLFVTYIQIIVLTSTLNECSVEYIRNWEMLMNVLTTLFKEFR